MFRRFITPYQLILYFILIVSCDQKTAKETKAPPARENAIQLILRNDCLNCHGVHDRLVGPPYSEISKKYQGNWMVREQLATKVSKGGSGLWYGGVMSAHPLLKPAEINKMVDWILALDERNKQFTLKAQRETLTAIASQTGGLFQLDILDPGGELKHPDNPYKQIGFANAICLMGNDLEGLNPKSTLRFRGTINIELAGRYVFRLRKTGEGLMQMDGMDAISNRENDMEAVREMEVGNHTIEVHFTTTGQSDTLVLSWITPEMGFFELVKK